MSHVRSLHIIVLHKTDESVISAAAYLLLQITEGKQGKQKDGESSSVHHCCIGQVFHHYSHSV